MKINKIYQKLKAKDPRYYVAKNNQSGDFKIYYKLAYRDLWGRDKFPLVEVSCDDYRKECVIRLDMRLSQKDIKLIIYPLKLLKKLDAPKEETK